jgi:hypothetical protein
VFDAAGRLIIDASTLDPVPEYHGDEEYFQIHRNQPDAGLFISRPMLHHGAYAIVLSRRITGPDGGFLGVVAARSAFPVFTSCSAASLSARTTPLPSCARTPPSSCAGRSTST